MLNISRHYYIKRAELMQLPRAFWLRTHMKKFPNLSGGHISAAYRGQINGGRLSTDMGIIFILISPQVETTAKNTPPPSPTYHISLKYNNNSTTFTSKNHTKHPASPPPESDLKNVGGLDLDLHLSCPPSRPPPASEKCN